MRNTRPHRSKETPLRWWRNAATAQLPLVPTRNTKERKHKGATYATCQQGNGTRLSQDESKAEKRTPLPLLRCEDRNFASILGSGR